MTWAILAYGGMAGVVAGAAMRAVLGLIETPRRLSHLRATLVAFTAAQDDDERQRLMLQAGYRTLTLSLMLFLCLSVACLVMVLPLAWVVPTGSVLAGYMAVSAAAALVGWRLRYGRP